MGEIEDLKKVDPAKRVKLLNELIDKRNKEIVEKSKELDEAKKLADTANKETRDIIALQERIRLPPIEGIANKVQDVAIGKVEGQYIPPEMPTEQILADIKNLYMAAKEEGAVNSYMALKAQSIQYAIERKEHDIHEGMYSANEEVMRQANSIKEIADKILTLYKGGAKDGIQVWN